MNFVSELFSDTLIYALGWTLLQSLLYGAFVAVLTLFLLFLLRNQNSSVRYQVSILSMFSIILLSVWSFISFYGYYDSLFATSGTDLISGSAAKLQNNFGIIWLDLLPDKIIENMDYFTTHLPLIFTVWFFCILFLSVKYLGAYAYSQRLKHNRVSVASDYWQEKLLEFSKRLNLKQKVSLLESTLIKVPIVIGYLKPVILVPIGFLTGIPDEQIEAILIHELAHIRRKDYLIKLVQTFVEILFFFNPFVWWISSIINKEREHSCDDLAISITKDNIAFVRALAGLCELEAKSSGLALAFGKSNNEIIKRMERIMKRNENKNNFIRFTIALVMLTASLVSLGAASFTSPESQTKTEMIEDSTKAKLSKISNEMKPPPPPPPPVIKDELTKIKKSIKKIKEAYNSEANSDMKKKYKEKLIKLEQMAKKISVNNIEQIKKIEKLKKKITAIKDKDKKKELMIKLEYLKQQIQNIPPPPPPPSKK